MVGVLFLTRRRPPPIRPAGELQREHQLYAENRPGLRLDPSRVPPNLRHLVPLAEKWGAFLYAQGALDEMGYFILEEKAKGAMPPLPAPSHLLRPEVAGGWGPNTEAQRHTHPPIVTHIRYDFEGWSGDDLLTTFPEFIVTENLARDPERSGLTGFRLTPVETSAGGMWL